MFCFVQIVASKSGAVFKNLGKQCTVNVVAAVDSDKYSQLNGININNIKVEFQFIYKLQKHPFFLKK